MEKRKNKFYNGKVNFESIGITGKSEVVFPTGKNPKNGLKELVAEDFVSFLSENEKNYFIDENIISISKVILELVPEEFREKHPSRRLLESHYLVTEWNGAVRLRKEKRNDQTEGMLEKYFSYLKG